MRRLIELALVAVAVSLVHLATFSLLSSGGATAAPPPCVPGDVTGDGAVDLLDPVALLNFLFHGGAPPVACGASPALTPEQAQVMSHMTIVQLDDGTGRTNKTIRFTGVNVQVVNGLGATNGNQVNRTSTDPLASTVNGLGNLIVGYNEPFSFSSPPLPDTRIGSHNLVLGIGNDYDSYGGLVVGRDNRALGPYSSVSGGIGNSASGPMSSVSGGWGNEATAFAASVSGGASNSAVSGACSVSGGHENVATAFSSSVSGGFLNVANNSYASVSGGSQNTASSVSSSVSGGHFNTASGPCSTVGGGAQRTASLSDSWTAGSLFESD